MAKHKGDSIHGWLIIDKQKGIGSTDVVNQTRRLLNASKNGHTGTLDPFATGVLPIAFGEATKLIPYVTDGDKEYEFVLKFGSTTDTLDPTGNIIQTGGKIPSQEEILAVLPKFIGTITQTPPEYSAASRRHGSTAKSAICPVSFTSPSWMRITPTSTQP